MQVYNSQDFKSEIKVKNREKNRVEKRAKAPTLRLAKPRTKR